MIYYTTRAYPRYSIYVFGDIFVWRSKGTGGAEPAVSVYTPLFVANMGKMMKRG